MVIGGLPTQEDIEKFKKKVHIVVGSPGRLRHLIQANHVDVSAVRLFVLDEADKLMDKSFQADINYIFAVLPKEKQVIMSSATYPELLKSVMKKYVQNAQHICPDSTAVLLGIKQLVTTVKSNSNIVRQTQNRFEELLKILSKKQFKQCLIFCNYQVRVRDLCKMLQREKWPAEQLHGQQEQTDRLDALKMLQEYKCRVLVSTDLAARGIDASNIDLVINFEPPHDWQTYLHRIGRAGRFGLYGLAITILSEGQEEIKFKKLINAINQSLDLKNLWDEDHDDCDEYNDEGSAKTPVKQKTENSDVYNELLNRLTNGNSNLKETESKIETFNDLLTCFESYKVNNNDFSANQLDKESNVCNTSNTVFTEFKTNEEMNESLIKSKDVINILYENNMSNSKEKDFLNISGANNQLQGVIINDRVCGVESDDSHHMHKALLDAGLPISFMSSKACKRKPRKVYPTEQANDEGKNCNTQTFTDNKHRESGNKNKHSPTELHGVVKNEICTDSYSGCYSDYSNKEIYSKYLNTDRNKNEQKKQSKNFNTKIHGRNDFQINYNETVDINKHKKYAIWYNKLKSYIEQIQMSVYIDELSNM